MTPKMAQQIDGKTLESLFVALGFSEKESKVYRIMLEIGQAPVATIMTKSNLKRGITYAVLYNLEKQSLVTSFNKKGKTYFQAEPPQKLLDLVKRKREDINSLETSLETIVPQLSAQYKLAVGKPIVRYFEGEEGVRRVFEDIYKSFNKEVVGCVDPGVIEPEIWTNVLKNLMPQRIKNKVFTIALNPDTAHIRELQKHDKEHLRKIYRIDTTKYPLPCEVDVWDDKVAFLSFKEHEFVGMIIENEDFAQTLRSVFKLTYDLLEEVADLKKKK